MLDNVVLPRPRGAEQQHMVQRLLSRSLRGTNIDIQLLLKLGLANEFIEKSFRAQTPVYPVSILAVLARRI